MIASTIDWADRRARLARAVARAKQTTRTDTVEWLASSCEFEVRRDPALSAWVESALGLKPRADSALWKRLGIGVCRATIHRDGTWEPFADGDVPREIAGRGVPVLTIPALRGGTLMDGAEVLDIFAVELAPGVPARATGRVYALTGLALGLGLDSFAFDEWRGWSKGLAVVGSPLDWVRAHRVAAGGMVAPFLGDPAGDGMPCVWLAELGRDEDAGDPDPDQWRAREIDRLLLESDPIVADSDDTALAIKARVARARKRAFPPNPSIQIEIGAGDAAKAQTTEGEKAA